MKKLHLYILITLLSIIAVSCADKQKIELIKLDSINISTKPHPLTITLNMEVRNSIRKDIEIIEGRVSLLPKRKLQVFLAAPVRIVAKQDKISVPLQVSGLNLLQLPALIDAQVVRIELEAFVKIGNKKPMKIKTQMPLNISELMSNALKNQDYEQ